MIGYVANETQSPEMLDALKWLYVLGVGTPFVIAIIVAFLYTLTKTRHQEVLVAIEKLQKNKEVDISQFKDLISMR